MEKTNGKTALQHGAGKLKDREDVWRAVLNSYLRLTPGANKGVQRRVKPKVDAIMRQARTERRPLSEVFAAAMGLKQPNPMDFTTGFTMKSTVTVKRAAGGYVATFEPGLPLRFSRSGSPLTTLLIPRKIGTSTQRSPTPHTKVNHEKVRKAIDATLARRIYESAKFDPPVDAAFCVTMDPKARTAPDDLFYAGVRLVEAVRAKGWTIVLKLEWEEGTGRFTWGGVTHGPASIREWREMMAKACHGGFKPQWAKFMEYQPTRQLQKWKIRTTEPMGEPKPFSDELWIGSREYWTWYMLKDPTFPLSNSILGCGPLAEAVTKAGCGFADESLIPLIEQVYARIESFNARGDEKEKRKEHQRARYGWKSPKDAKTKNVKSARR